MTSASGPLFLAHDGITIRVDGPDRDRSWLAEFLEPAFSRADGQEEGVRVSFEEAVDGPPPVSGDHEVRVAFALDAAPVRLPAAAHAGGMRLQDPEAGVEFEVGGGGRETRLRYRGSRLAARVRLMRVVREYAHNHALGGGGVILHAAAVVLGGRALVVAGAKGAGKTTLALRLLAAPGTAYLANDRVLVRGDAEARALGVPTVVTLRPGTLALLPRIGARLRMCGDFRESRGERAARGPSPPVGIDGGLRVSAAQLCAALERDPEATAALAAVLFPLTGAGADSPLRRLGRDEAETALAGSLLGVGSRTFASEVFVGSPGPPPDEAALRSRCRALASRVPCYAGRLSDGATAEDAAAFLRHCVEGET
jgi:hypothetical protein